MLSSAEDHAAGRDLLLRGAGRGEVLPAAQRRRQSMRRDRGHGVGHWDAALLELFVQVHDHSALLLRGMMLLMTVVMVMCSGV